MKKDLNKEAQQAFNKINEGQNLLEIKTDAHKLFDNWLDYMIVQQMVIDSMVIDILLNGDGQKESIIGVGFGYNNDNSIKLLKDNNK